MISGAANARALRLSWAAFAVASAAFGVSALSFSDPQYLGRQARETFTHGLVTVPLAVGTCLGLAEPPRGVRISWLSRPRHYWRGSETTAAFACGFLLLYQAAAVIVTGSQKHAQTQDFVRVVCGHFFEHTLSYLVVPVHAALFYLAGAPSAKT